MSLLESMFRQQFGCHPEAVTPLTGSGSHRRYFRLSGQGFSVIGVEGTDKRENEAFIALDRHFSAKGIRVPRVLCEEGLCYLQEDLGDESLYGRAVEGGRFNRALLRKTMQELPRIQIEGARGLDWSVCYPQPAFDGRMVDFDLNYFKYDYLKLAGAEFDETLLQDDFDRLKADLLSEPSDTFLYRDFNARNVMVRDGEPWFIDFQGGRRGPLYYDVASFVWQARAAYPADLREELVKAYLDALKAYMPVDEVHFRERLRLFVLFRMLQVLGAYGFRGLWERKKHFIESIPFALKNVRELLPLPQYPYLSKVLAALDTPREVQPAGSSVASPLVSPAGLASGETSALTVTVYSFSFKKGIPSDASGNGGGYVFDCRGTHNPGKYDAYKQLTGLDKPVTDFLEQDGEILRFLESVYTLVDAHVQRFLERGFTHLQVSFGCTGGQHRSVYAAEHLAAHLKEHFPVKVHLVHRERDIVKDL